MKTFQNINKEYVPSVDLNTLGKTFDTLEQGHKEAVKAASDLDMAIAALEMDESEDSFKQQLSNEIKSTLDENTIYGNAYSALDDLILKQGNIISDGGVQGRLRNHAAKKQFDAKVDAMNMPEGMKQMYKDLNPYYYKDGEVDSKTGRTLPGEIWKVNPNHIPVTTVAKADIQKQALAIAAEESGSGESISFLDENGKPTSDPSKSATGEMYKKVGTSYKRLSADKIARAYRVAIDSIPGAKDSLMQDYKYDIYQNDKGVEVNGLTDKDGNLYSFDKWLDAKIKGFSALAAYNHTTTNISFGTALQSRKAVMAQQRTTDPMYANNRLGNIIGGKETVETNAFAEAVNGSNAATRTLHSIIKNNKLSTGRYDNIKALYNDWLRNDKKVTGPGSFANKYLATYGKNLSREDKSRFINAMHAWYVNDNQVNNFVKKTKDKDALLFSTNIANETYTGDNKYGRQIIKELNGIYKNKDKVTFQVGADVMDNLRKAYSFDNLSQFAANGIDVKRDQDGNYIVSISADNRMKLPRFAKEIRDADANTPSTMGGWLTKTFTTGVGKGNYYEQGRRKQGDLHYDVGETGTLADIYKSSLKTAASAEEKVGLTKGTKSFAVGSYDTFGSAYAAMNPASIPEGENLQQYSKRQSEQLDKAFASGDWVSALITYDDGLGVFNKDISKDQEAKNIIQSLYANNNWRNHITRVIKIPSGTEAKGSQGYKLTFTVPKELGGKHFEEGKTYSVLVSGISNEENNFNPAMNPNVLASNTLANARATGQNAIIGGYSSSLGETNLLYHSKGRNAGKYSTSFMGSNAVMNEETAEGYATNIFALQQLKMNILAGSYNYAGGEQMARNAITNICSNLSTATNEPFNQVYMSVMNYLREPLNE